MASEASFDVVSKVDRQEVDNALNQAAKEVGQRYDFKNVGASIAWSGETILIPRRISLVWNTSRTALHRSGELAVIRIVSPLQAIEAPTFLKSYRWPTSLAAWFSALSTS